MSLNSEIKDMKMFLSNLLMVVFLTVASGCTTEEVENKTPNVDNKEPGVTEIVLNHPCMLHTDNDFAYVKKKIEEKAEPWYMGFQKLKDKVNIYYTPKAIEVTDRSKPGFADPSRDAEAAYQMALMWRLTGDKAYANAAIRILNAWAKINKSMGSDANEIIVVGYCGYKFANAAEMIRDYSEWRKEDFEIFKLWMVGVLYNTCYQYLALHYEEDPMNTWLSWDAPILASALSIGILCDDMEKVNYALNYFYEGAGPACINKAVVDWHEDPAGNVKGKHLAQTTESGREMGHAMTTVTMYGYICQMAYNIGIDLFAYKDNVVLDICEYLAKYNVNPNEDIDMPFTPYNTIKEGWKSIIGQNDPSKRGQRVVGYELIYNHYKCKGANPYYSREFARTMRPEGEGVDFGTLMYTREPIEEGEDKAAETER